MGARISQIPLTLRTFNAKNTAWRDVTSFTVTNLDETLKLEINNALVSDLFSTDKDRPPRNSMTRRHAHLKNVKFYELEDPMVGLIIDAKHAWSWLPIEVRMGGIDQPLVNKSWTN